MTQPRGTLNHPDLLESRCYIGGKWQGGNAAPIAVDDPFTLEEFGQVPDLGAAETQAAIDAASAAFPPWAGRPARERGLILRRWCALIEQHRDDLATLITRENGKSIREAQGELDYGNGYMEFYADEATRALGEIIPSHIPGRRMVVEREPVGVCALITPWNFPLAMLTRKVAPALAARCTVVCKPSELTPLTALAFAKLGEEAGVPPGVVNIVTGDARAIGGVLTGSMAVRKLSFTGSTPVGVLLAQQCAATMKRVSLELGGNAPMLIFDNADLDIAVDAALTAKFRNGGQSCIAANRIYAQAGIHDRFVAALADKIGTMTVGDGFDPTMTVGPLIDDRAVRKVDSHREEALAGGAQCLAGGASPGGRLSQPTLLAGVAKDAQLTREETFGPLASVISFATEDEGIHLANDTPFGLAGYVCSNSPALIAKASRALQTGMVAVNTGLLSSAHAPFGGVKMSGLGREGSHHGLEDYLNMKYVCEGSL